jgi:regulator of protease activity HflC (stomatin/prohibitin superfamily)
MLFLRFLFFVIAVGALTLAAGIVLYDIWLAFELNRLLQRRPRVQSQPLGEGETPAFEAAPPARLPRQPGPRRAIRWSTAAKFSVIAALSALVGQSIIVVPDGEAGVRISQISGVRPGTLYPGVHLIVPLFTRVELYDTREKVFSTAALPNSREKGEVLSIEAREGLSVGLAVAVRYRIDPSRLDYIQTNLPQPLDEQIVAPVVTSAFRELGPNYVIRDVFSTKREEIRGRAAQIITARLADDAIVVKEVLLRKVALPEEYSKGLEGLLLKEQEDDRTSVDAEIEQKRVKIAESQAEAAKIREVKHAEGDAQARVIQAKAEADAMQYTLPLKQKQIEQSRLEAEARKETTLKNAEAEAAAKVKNAEAEAQAKVIDSKAEQERRGLLADADANRIRLTARAESEKLQLEAAALKSNPLLIQKIVAEKLSDKIQIMMVPTDGKFFFPNDVLRSMQSEEDPPAKAGAK